MRVRCGAGSAELATLITPITESDHCSKETQGIWSGVAAGGGVARSSRVPVPSWRPRSTARRLPATLSPTVARRGPKEDSMDADRRSILTAMLGGMALLARTRRSRRRQQGEPRDRRSTSRRPAWCGTTSCTRSWTVQLRRPGDDHAHPAHHAHPFGARSRHRAYGTIISHISAANEQVEGDPRRRPCRGRVPPAARLCLARLAHHTSRPQRRADLNSPSCTPLDA